MAPEEVRKSLLDASKKAEEIFYSSGDLSKKMRDMENLIAGLTFRWIKEGHVE